MFRYLQLLTAHFLTTTVWLLLVTGIVHTPFRPVGIALTVGTFAVGGPFPFPTGANSHLWAWIGLLLLWQGALSLTLRAYMHANPSDLWAGASFGALVAGVTQSVLGGQLVVPLTALLVGYLFAAAAGALWHHSLAETLLSWWRTWFLPHAHPSHWLPRRQVTNDPAQPHE